MRSKKDEENDVARNNARNVSALFVLVDNGQAKQSDNVTM